MVPRFTAVAGVLLLLSGTVAYAQGISTGAPVGIDISKLTPEQLKEFNKLSPAQKNELLDPKPPEYPEGTVNCLDYFGFGDVSIDVSPVSHVTAPGVPLTFSGKVVNPFDYPIVEGQIYAKIFYKDAKTGRNLDLNGYRLIDQFIAVDNITLKAKEQEDVSFLWQVPDSARTGDYEIAFYYSSAYAYNLTGLTFTNDVTGNKATFAIANNTQEGGAYFDEDSVFLNETHFYFARPIPKFSKDDKVTAHATLINPSAKEATVEVSWQLYSWDALPTSNVRAEETQTVVLKPKETRSIAIDVPAIDTPASYLVLAAKDQGTQSILDIRFGRLGLLEARNNRLGILTYPIKKGEPSSLIACAHLVAPSKITDTKITVLLKDMQGQILHTYEYTKGITPEVLGFKDDFVLDRDLYDFTLTSIIEQEGKKTEEITIHYTCSDIDPTLCSSSSKYLYVTLAALVLIIAAAVVLKRRKEAQPTPPL